MPTNECKDQLTFSLRERSSCEKSDDCEDNEVCYLNTKVCKSYKYFYYDGYLLFQKCVCNLGFIEKSGACVSMKSLNCSETNSTKVKIY